MADAPEIKVKLTAEDTGVAAAIKELTTQLKTLKKQQDETAASGFTLKKAFEGLAVAGGLLKLEEVGREAFNSAVNIGKMADKTGLTTQTLSVFHRVADDVGASTETVDKSLQKAASTITQFEQGVGKSTKGFQLLNLTQKDFANLKPDEKLLLVTDRLGKMQAGFAKAEAQRQIFGKGAGDLTLVLNQLAAEGFDKAREETSKLGLLLDQDTTDSFRSAKASVQELGDVFQGMATQIEAGLLPAVSDIGEAFADSLTQGGVSFKTLGQYAGEVVRGIGLVFLGLGQTIGTVAESIYDVFHKAWELISGDFKNFADVASLALKGKFQEASDLSLAHAKQNLASVTDEINRQKAIFGSLGDSLKSDVANLFPSDEEEERRRKARIAKLRPEKQTEAPELTGGPTDAAGKAALSLLERQLQDQLAIHRAFAAQSEAIDKELYDKGEISLEDYYSLRRQLIERDTKEEVAILEQGVVAAQAEVQKAALEKSKATTPKEADKQEANRLQALAKVDELQTKISTLQISSATKIHALETEQFKQTEENNQKILEFRKLIDASQGKGIEVAEEEIAIERQKLEIILRQSGESEEAVQAELAKYTALKTAQATFDQEQKEGAAALKSIEDQKALIQDKVANGQLFQIQADQQIRDLEQQRLPALQQIAAQLVEQAKLTGDIQKIQAAEDFQRQVTQLGTASNQVGQQVATLKANVQQSLTGGFANLFTTLISGTRSVGDAFRNLAGSVLNSLSQIAAQMLAQLILTKLLKSALGGFAGGGLVGGGAAPGHAEGGLIRGPGGPTSDSIPARVSPGEYIVKASAVQEFGVHNLEAINRGLKVPSLERLSLPKFAEGGLVGNPGGGGGDSQIHLGIGLDEGLILKHLSTKAAGNVILQHLSNNPKAAQKALSRSD